MDITKYRNKLIGSDDERAVSPVIGVILMVAITVILAAVIAAFVLDIGDLDDSAPNAQFDWSTDTGEYDDATNITLTHESGDDIDASSLHVSIDDGSETVEETLDGEFTAGDTIEFGPSDDSDKDMAISGVVEDTITNDDITDFDSAPDEIEEITVTWEGDGSSTIIAEHEP